MPPRRGPLDRLLYVKVARSGCSGVRPCLPWRCCAAAAASSPATAAPARTARRAWCTPWSAPGEWKDNGDADHGGHLCARAGQGSCTAAHYRDWADRLVAFAGALEQGAGVPLYALSVQNEPDMSEDYPSLNMTPGEFAELAKVLGPRLARLKNLVRREDVDLGQRRGVAVHPRDQPRQVAPVPVLPHHQLRRFVRPGWRRVEVDGGAGGLVASAYRDPASGAFAVVVENCSTTGDVAVEVDVSGAEVEGVEPWVTAGTPVDAIGTDGNLSRGSASAGLPGWIPVRDGVFRATVPYGVTTFVGRPAGR